MNKVIFVRSFSDRRKTEAIGGFINTLNRFKLGRTWFRYIWISDSSMHGIKIWNMNEQ